MDAVSRKGVLEIIDKADFRYKVEYEKCKREIKELPSVEPERPKGRWFDVGSLSCRCSACRCKNNRETKYCPNCGAKMEVF